MPLYSPGLWLAVIITPAMAPSSCSPTPHWTMSVVARPQGIGTPPAKAIP